MVGKYKITMHFYCTLYMLLEYLDIHTYMFSLKVHMKPNLFLHSCKIFHLKCKIPKFEMARTKIDDFKSAESWAILP